MQGDLFGPNKTRSPRGWTELDKIRRRYATLDKKIKSGEYSVGDMEEFSNLKAQIAQRENEARAKWERSFGK